MAEKLKITWDDLKSQKVEAKLKQQEILRQTQEHYQSAPAPQSLHRHQRTSLWYNTLVYMSLFGALGGLLGWGCGQLLHIRPNIKAEAADFVHQQRSIQEAVLRGLLTPAEAEANLSVIRASAQNNPYFLVFTDTSLSDAEKDAAIQRIAQQERTKDFVANILSFGVSGLLVALCLAAAEPLVERNFHAAALNGGIGAVLGLLGGVVVCLIQSRLEQWILPDPLNTQLLHRMMARSASWGVVGLFLTVAPGVMLRNMRRMIVGLAGGLLGGIVGGLLFDPIIKATQSESLSRLAGLLAIGIIAGVGTGLLESAAKSGWLKVVSGVIAGKQFVLYRNPTYLGSSPHCQVYLFKDPKVGKRHAAVHMLPGGFELENLPLGGATLLNAQPVTRARLRNGDRIQVGSFIFQFFEKTKQ